MNRHVLMLLVALAVSGCKSRDPKPSARVPPDATPADARPIAPLAHPREGARVAAGSLLAPTIEVRFAVVLPTRATAKTRAALQAEARGLGFEIDGSGPERWLSILDATPTDLGYDPWGEQVLLEMAPEDEAKVREAEGAISLWAGGSTTELEEIHAGVTALARRAAVEGGGWILDEQTDIVFDLASFDGGPALSARNPIHLISYYDEDGEDADGLRVFETMGMVRFGLPELRVRDVPTSIFEQLGSAIDATAQTILDRGGLTRDGAVDVDVSTLPAFAEVAAECARSHGTGKLAWQVTWTEFAEDDTPILELEAVGAGPRAQRLGGALDAFYGIASLESEEIDPHSPVVQTAARESRAAVEQLRTHFDQGIPDGESLSVLAPFDLDDGGKYWLWVDVTRWKGRSWLTGVITSSPPPGAHLTLGQTVDLAISTVLDYVHVRADGTEAGNLLGED